MKPIFYLMIFSIFAGFSGQAQEMNRKIVDERYNKEILIGYCDREGLEEGEFGETFALEYKDYSPQPKITKKLKRRLKDISIVIVLGTWCHDSREQVPRFYKILDNAGFKDHAQEIICLNGYKEVEDIPMEDYNIEMVPTFIFYKQGQEIGRIIESPEKSLEEDILNIVRML